MREGTPRPSRATEYEKQTGLSFKERARVVLIGVLASASLTGVLFATTSTAGSGGVGSGGGSGGSDGGASASKYERIWDGFKSKDKKWAKKTSDCESGGNAHIHDSSHTYHGAFQFTKSTWKSSPKSVGADPHKYPWKTQAVVAVLLKHQQGSSPWPVCG